LGYDQDAMSYRIRWQVGSIAEGVARGSKTRAPQRESKEPAAAYRGPRLLLS